MIHCYVLIWMLIIIFSFRFQLVKMGVKRVGILGAGVVGLNTAIQLQKEFPTLDVTIIAEKFNQETTSDGAAGLFRPSPSFGGPSVEVTK